MVSNIAIEWCIVVCCAQNVRRNGNSFAWHLPCDITGSRPTPLSVLMNTQSLCVKLHFLSHIRLERSESDREWRTALYKSSSHQYGNDWHICLLQATDRAKLHYMKLARCESLLTYFLSLCKRLQSRTEHKARKEVSRPVMKSKKVHAA